jgi:hypothetical protein
MWTNKVEIVFGSSAPAAVRTHRQQAKSVFFQTIRQQAKLQKRGQTMAKGARNKVRSLPEYTDETYVSGAEVFPCADCGREFTTETGRRIHESRVHGIKDITPKPGNKRKVFRMTLEQKMKIANYLKTNRDRIHEKRLTKNEVIDELCEVFAFERLSASHIDEPAKYAQINFPKGFKAPPQVVIKQDNKTLLTLALAIQEIYAKLADLLGDTPRIITQLKEQLQEELRKEQEAKAKSESTNGV